MAVFDGTPGNDTLLGGDGDDTLRDAAGNDSIHGGAGNDLIDIVRVETAWGDRFERITLAGGSGNDTVSVDVTDGTWYLTKYRVDLAVDLGAGNDCLFIAKGFVSGTAVLGEGRDQVELGADYVLGFAYQPIVIADFQAGDGGDVLQLARMMQRTNWDEASNPFAGGFLRLFQQGPDTLVSIDSDGAAGIGSWATMFRLLNIDAASLTAANFGGWAPDRSALVAVTAPGTAGDDLLTGGPAADSLTGLAGNDRLEGGFGNDTLDGSEGDDTLVGGRGTDRLLGGAGNDFIEDLDAGLDTFSGGDGNDRIVVQEVSNPQVVVPIAIDGGAGDDEVDALVYAGALQVALGDGNDRVVLRWHADGGTTLSLGGGSDVVAFDLPQKLFSNESFTVTDFQPGDGGDRLDWLGYARMFAGSTDPDFNPFAANYARLVQSGADTVLQMRHGTSFWAAFVILKNTTAANLTPYNFGTDIHATPQVPETDTHTGTASADSLTGTSGRDLMSGLGGNDTLVGLEGNDWLRGGDGRDSVNGGDGDDTIDDPNGTDTVLGGTGNDVLNITVTDNPFGGNSDAGSGNDVLNLALYSYSSATYAASMGSGDDVVNVRSISASTQLSLGEGQDRIALPANYTSFGYGRGVVVSDFQPGDGGDVLDLSAYMASLASSHAVSSPGKSGFELGYFQLVQAGAHVEFRFMVSPMQGDDTIAWIRFENTTLGQFTPHNFAGVDPHVAGNGPIKVTGAITVEAGVTEAAMNPTATAYERAHYFFANSSAALVNHGTILTESTTQGPTTTGVDIAENGSSGASFVNASDGVFTVRSHYTGASSVWSTGVQAGNVGLDFRNDGAFEVLTADGTAIGVYFPAGSNADRIAINDGTMTIEGSELAIGADLGSDASFTNNGSLHVSSDLAGVGIRFYANPTAPIPNNGVLTVEAGPDAAAVSIGVLVRQESHYTLPYVHNNTGTVTADFAWFVDELDDVGFADTLNNSGQMNGHVVLGRGNDVVSNSGGMSGRTLLGEGNDSYAGATGTHAGTVEGGTGNDTLQGGAGAESLAGDGGADSLSGGGGNDTLAGGSGNDVLAGGGGVDTVTYARSLLPVTVDLAAGTGGGKDEADALSGFEQAVGSRSGDTLLGSAAADTLHGFHGADSIDGRGGDDALVGGRGADTLTGGAGNDRFLFDAGDGADRIADFAFGDTIEVSGYTAASAVVQEGSSVRITLSDTDSIVVANTTVAAVQSALGFGDVPHGVVVPGLDSESLVVDANLVIAQGVDYSLGNTVSTASDMQGLATLDGLPASTAVFMHPATGLWNAGSLAIATTAASATTYGVTTVPGMSGVNQLVNHATGIIRVTAAASDAIGVDDLDGVWNLGLLEVTSSSGDATGVGGLPGSQDSFFVNSGTIRVDAAGSGLGAGMESVSSNSSGQYFNSGLIDVHGGAASVGLQVVQQRANYSYVVNSGTIEVSDETSILDSVGVRIGTWASNQLFNAGTIRADFAILATGPGQGLDYTPYGLGVFNTGTIEGYVSMGGTSDRLVNTGAIEGRVFMGEGNDRFDGRGGTLDGVLEGYDGNDTLLGGANADSIDGGFGRDVLAGGGGNDTLVGGADVDSFRFGIGGGRDVIVDYETGSSRDNIWIEGYFSYQSITQTADGVLLTFPANDSLLVRGATVANLTAPGAIFFGVIPVAATDVPAVPDTPPPPPEPGTIPPGWLTGTEGNDTLTGDELPNRLDGLGGADLLVGGIANDTLLGGSGNDTLDGGSGNDLLEGGSFQDTAVFNGGAAISVNLTTGIATGEGTDTLRDIEHVIAGAGNDLIVGNIQWNRLDGGEGNDTIESVPSLSADTIIGGAGIDTATWANYGFGILVELSDNYVSTPSGNSSISGVENVIGSSGGDWLIGDANANQLSGGFGEDTLEGLAGNDTLLGGDSYDTLTGGTGNDSLDGGAFNDVANYTGSYAQYSIGYDSVTGAIWVTDTVGNRDGLDVVTNVESFAFSDGVRTATDLRNWGVGTSGNDQRNGTAVGDSLNGMAGNDSLNGLDGDDTLVGGLGNDSLTGGNGNDRLEPGSGSDTLDGGAGNDVAALPRAPADYALLSRTASDVVIRHAASGDTVTLRNVEFVAGPSGPPIPVTDLYLNQITEQDDFWTGTAGDDSQSGLGGHDQMDGVGGHDTLLGAAGNDTLSGGEGNDRLDGGAGNDSLAGGEGNDTFVVDSAFDLIAAADPGIDRAEVAFAAAGTFVMPAGVESATVVSAGTLAVHVTGNEGDNAITGNAGNNSLAGAGGNDTLDGGAGNDSLVGGAGDDTYLVGAAGDLVTEALNAGIDTVEVQFTVTYVLGANVENARITAPAGGNVTGNALANSIVGSASANSLLGGDGNDTLAGGAGNDTIDGGTGTADVVVLADARDQYTAARPAAAEVVLTQVGTGQVVRVLNTEVFRFSDGDRSFAEMIVNTVSPFNDTWTGTGNNDTVDGGAGDDNLSGQGGNDTLLGNAGNDTLSGGAGNDNLNGGAGNDSTAGGEGDDTYTVDAPADLVLESPDQGNDLVNVALASGTYAMAAGVENATVTATAAVHVTGNALDNTITGNAVGNNLQGGDGKDLLSGGAGNDTLAGGNGDDTLNGGVGTDSMTGGAGNDTYVVSATTDIVMEAGVGDTDAVVLEFTAAGTYTLGANIENGTIAGALSGVNLTGNTLANDIRGNAGNNSLSGGAGGNDTLSGGGGNDTIDGGTDTDTLVLTGVAGDYAISRPSATQTVFSKAGTQVTVANVEMVRFDSGTVTLASLLRTVGSTGNDSLVGNAAAEVLDGGAGNDTLVAGAGDDTLLGGAGNDLLAGGAGSDWLDGGAGNDTYTFDTATLDGSDDYIVQNDTVGGSVDTVAIVTTGIVTYSRGDQGYDDLVIQVVEGPEGLEAVHRIVVPGFFDNDAIAGGTIDRVQVGATILTGSQVAALAQVMGDGESVFVGVGSNDTLAGNAADNWMLAGAGNDSVAGGLGSDTLFGGAGTDTLAGGAGDDLVAGGAGNDQVTGGAGDDTLAGGAGSDTYTWRVGDGNDTIVERGQPMTAGELDSGIGPVYVPGDGDSPVSADSDVLVMQGVSQAAVRATRNGDDLVVTHLASGDAVRVEAYFAAGVSTIERISFADASWNATTIRNKVLVPTTGDDEITGYLGGDQLSGLAGDDTLSGMGGNDVLQGGAGADVLWGGSGADRFVIDSIDGSFDAVMDFGSGDTLAISASAMALTGAGKPAVGSRVGTSGAFVTYDAGSGELWVDRDGGGSAWAPVLVAVVGVDQHPTIASILVVA
jgi:Ca2+-binding RTX toxin-like protein